MKNYDGFEYRNKTLYCENVSLEQIAEEVGTPSYVYSKTAFENRIRRLQLSLQNLNSEIFFAVKANSNIHLLSIVNKMGCGADIVSGGELFRATVAQIGSEKIIFSGVGKSAIELQFALDAEINLFNIESKSELDLLQTLASMSYKKNGKKARVLLRINPNIDAKTHPAISTGLKKNKFGLDQKELMTIYRDIKRYDSIHFIGLSCHIGSQITKRTPYLKAWDQLLKQANAAPFHVTELDIGGGLGISYADEKTLSIEDYGNMVKTKFLNTEYKINLEPGRSLIGPTGVLLTSSIRIKNGSKNFLVLDSGMNDLMRPALYKSIHKLWPLKKDKSKARVFDIVGPICESTDIFEKNVKLIFNEANKYFVFLNAGAYGMSMASQYNSRPRPAEVLVSGSTYQVIRRRENFAELINHEI